MISMVYFLHRWWLLEVLWFEHDCNVSITAYALKEHVFEEEDHSLALTIGNEDNVHTCESACKKWPFTF